MVNLVVRTGLEPVFNCTINFNVTLYIEVLTQFHFALKRLPIPPPGYVNKFGGQYLYRFKLWLVLRLKGLPLYLHCSQDRIRTCKLPLPLKGGVACAFRHLTDANILQPTQSQFEIVKKKWGVGVLCQESHSHLSGVGFKNRKKMGGMPFIYKNQLFPQVVYCNRLQTVTCTNKSYNSTFFQQKHFFIYSSLYI